MYLRVPPADGVSQAPFNLRKSIMQGAVYAVGCCGTCGACWVTRLRMWTYSETLLWTAVKQRQTVSRMSGVMHCSSGLTMQPVKHQPGALCYCSSDGSWRYRCLDADPSATRLADNCQQGLQHGHAAKAPSGCCVQWSATQHLVHVFSAAACLHIPTGLVP